MKIAIINTNSALSIGGGVLQQGIMWHDGLELLGHECDLINFGKIMIGENMIGLFFCRLVKCSLIL